MAIISTSTWGASGPAFQVSIEKSYENNNQVVYSWIASFNIRYSNYFSTSTYAAPWVVYKDGSQIGSGSYNYLNKSSGLKQVGSGNFTIYKTSQIQTTNISISVNWGNFTWNGISRSNDGASGSVQTSAKQYLKTPLLNGSSNIIKPTDLLKVSWSQQPGNGHYINLIISDNTNTVIYSNSNISGSLSSIDIDLNNYTVTRGRTLTATIQAISGDSNFSNSDSNSITIAKINNQPQAPSVSESGLLVNGGQKIDFTVTAGSDTESSQTKTLSYSIGASQKKEFTSPLKFGIQEAQELGIEKTGTYTINFYTYDGLEYSAQPTSKNITINFAPTFTTQEEQYTLVRDGFGELNLVSQAILKFTLQVNATTGLIPRLFLKSAKTEEEVVNAQELEITRTLYNFNISSTLKTIEIDIGKIPEDQLPRGNYFSFSYTISDSFSESQRSNWSSLKQRPFILSVDDFPEVKIINDASGNIPVFDNWFKEKLTFNFTNPIAKKGYPDISSVEVYTISNNIQTSYTTSNEEGAAQLLALKLDSVLAGKEVDIYLKITDVAGQIVISSLLGTFTKTTGISFANSEIYLTSNEVSPLSNNNDFKIAHSPAQSGGTRQEDIIFDYKMRVKEKELVLDKERISIETIPDLITITIDPEYMKFLGNELVEYRNNIKETVTIIVVATDGFNNNKQITTNLLLNFTERPILPNLDFYLRHDYQTNNVQAPADFGIIVPTFLKSDEETYNLDVRMFNAREGLIFAIPIASDKNEDIVSYEISISRNNFNEIDEVIVEKEKLIFTSWLTLSKENQLDNCPKDENYYYYRYSISEYTRNEYFYFKLRVKDSQGNYSEEKISNTFIIGCRTVAPKFSIGSVSVERQPGVESGKDNIYLRYNLQITDLGGSATDIWDKYYYNKYKNFERNFNDINGQKYIPKIYLLVQISPTQSFGEVYPEVPEYITGSSPLLDYTQTETLIKNFPSFESKIYMKFTLVVSYGLDSSKQDGLAIVTSASQIFSYFGAVPTVAHRSHKVGINTTNFDNEEVFVVENYQGNRYIIFRGIDPINAEKTYQIKIDLLTSSIDGAIINCGSWD